MIPSPNKTSCRIDLEKGSEGTATPRRPPAHAGVNCDKWALQDLLTDNGLAIAPLIGVATAADTTCTAPHGAVRVVQNTQDMKKRAVQ